MTSVGGGVRTKSNIELVTDERLPPVVSAATVQGHWEMDRFMIAAGIATGAASGGTDPDNSVMT